MGAGQKNFGWCWSWLSHLADVVLQINELSAVHAHLRSNRKAERLPASRHSEAPPLPGPIPRSLREERVPTGGRGGASVDLECFARK